MTQEFPFSNLKFLPFLFLALFGVNAAIFPPDFQMTGEVEETQQGLVVKDERGVKLEGEVPAGVSSVVFRVRLGADKPKVFLTLKDEEEEATKIAFRMLNEKYYDKIYDKIGINYSISGKNKSWANWYFRPKPDFYKKDEWKKREAKWTTLPDASQTSFTMELRFVGGQMQVWVEDQLMNTIPFGTLSNLEISLSKDCILEELRLGTAPSTLVLPVEKNARPGALGQVQLQFAKDADLPAGLKDLAEGKRSGISIGGLGTFNAWMNSDLQSFYWRRHASHHFPEQRMFSVPLATYSHAWVLLAQEENPGKTDTFTFRVTRYGNSRGNAMADTIVRVPKTESEDARRVGTANYEIDGKRKEVPLWLVRVPIHNGWIQDILYDDTRHANGVGTYRYLDIELLETLRNVDASRAFPPSQELLERQWKHKDESDATVSGITVFGIELEKSPVEMRVSTNPAMKAFYEADHAEFIAKVHADKAGDYRVEWKVADVDGQIVDTVSQTLKLEASTDTEVKLPVKKDHGWFAVQARLTDAQGHQFIDKQSSYVMLPPDTRKAGYESPFYGWWFGANHSSPVTLEQGGPLLQRLGMRGAELGEAMPESLTSKYQFTNPSVNWIGVSAFTKFRKGELTLEQAIAEHEANIRKHLELWPHANHMLVWHESDARSAPFPSEMWGEPAVNYAQTPDENSSEVHKEGGDTTPAAKAKEEKLRKGWESTWPQRLTYLKAMAKMVREKFPQLKMQYGNAGNSLTLVGELFRQKFPREYMDSIAIEDLGQTIVPEAPRLGAVHSAWFLREAARKMGYADMPVSACTEWIGRMTEKLGLQTQAEWKVRDGLLGLAYGFNTLSIGGLNDAGDAYYYSIWANGGLTGRWPEMAPKPAYAAIATLTQVVDSAKFTRFVPTGSTVLYVQEFQRGDEWIYAIWTPRGTREMQLDFEKDGKRQSIDLYGREKAVEGKALHLKAGTAVQYLVSNDRLQSVKAGVSAFPEDQVPKEILEEIPLDSLDVVEVIDDPIPENSSHNNVKSLPKMRQGKFEVREVDDPEMGTCLEVELIPEGKTWDMEYEYVVFKLKTPVKTTAQNAGVWIKGNGSWGQFANGNTTRGPGVINFDGWNFLHYYHNMDESKIIRGFLIAIPRKTIVGAEMQPVEPLKVRIKKIILSASAPKAEEAPEEE